MALMAELRRGRDIRSALRQSAWLSAAFPGALKIMSGNSRNRTSAAEEVAEKVKIAVIPRSEATRNLSFCGHLNQEGSLASLGMTAFMLFSAACKAGLISRHLRHD